MNRPHFTTGLALPMHQPWASLAAAGVKTIETRPRASHVRGRIGIFACRFVPPYVYDLLDSKEGRVLVHLCQRHLPGFDPTRRGLGLPLGQVIALVDQYGSVPIVAERPGFAACIKHRHDADTLWLLADGQHPADALEVTDQLPFGDFRSGRHGWLWRNVELLAEPVEMRGHQGWMRWADPAG